MADLTDFAEDVDAAKPADSYDPIPAGTYNAVITESEVKDTINGTGQQLKLRWQIIEGDHEGRLVFDRVTLRNKNPQAVEIGMRQLKSIALAVGHTGKLSDSAELHGTPCLIKVKVRPAGPGSDGKHYEASNEVKGYEAPTSAPSISVQQSASMAASTSRPQQVAKPAAATQAPARKPWERK